ncbi:MAG: hypothetical protein AB7I79_04950 [Rhizobiaceae bacterium]
MGGKRSNTRSSCSGVAAAILLAGLAETGHAASPTPALHIERLKRTYVACERAAATRVMGSGDAIHCSSVYEELKRLAFGGDYARLKEWWSEQKRLDDLAW